MWDRARLKAPAKIGAIVQKVALARWARTLSSLTSAGVPMLEAIDVTGRTAGNTVVENAMVAVHNSVQGGGTIASALADEPIFPSLVTNMVRVGEETGALDSTLGKVADFYEEQVEAAVKALTSILEPIMIAVVGTIVGLHDPGDVPADVPRLRRDQVSRDAPTELTHTRLRRVIGAGVNDRHTRMVGIEPGAARLSTSSSSTSTIRA